MILIEGAVLAVVAYGAGIISGRRKVPKPPKPAKLPAAVCGCSHHYSMHDPKTGECHAGIKVQTASGKPILNSWGDRVIGYNGATYEVLQCGCKRYTGPEPLPTYYAPEIGG